MESTIHSLIEDVVNIYPIGHHELKRHLVYKVETKTDLLVVKFYYLKNRYESEVCALQLLQNTNVPVPILISFGSTEERDYIIYRYEEGMILDKVTDINKENLKEIYQKSGEYLKEIHRLGQELPYGRLAIHNYTSFSESMSYEINRIYHHLKADKHPNSEIIDKGIQSLEIEKHKIADPIKGLCHMDYSARNILVRKIDNKYEIVKIIDFEQATISDIKRDLVNVYQKYLKKTTDLNEFSKGYNRDVKDLIFSDSSKAYHLHYGLSICSWSLTVDKRHYQEGIDILLRYTNNQT